MKIITIAQQKGGAGKTTVTAHLATTIAKSGKRILLIDVDSQGSLSQWYKIREEKLGADFTGFQFVSCPGWRIENILNKYQNEFDYAVIDSPPHTETDSKTAIRASDLVIIPMQLSPTDIWATSETVEFTKKEGINAKILLNRFNPNSKLSKELLPQVNSPMFKNYFGNRVAYASSIVKGLSVIENDPNSIASTEVKNVTKELLSFFQKNSLKKEFEAIMK